jgi:hypothetical protein
MNVYECSYALKSDDPYYGVTRSIRVAAPNLRELASNAKNIVSQLYPGQDARTWGCDGTPIGDTSNTSGWFYKKGKNVFRGENVTVSQGGVWGRIRGFLQWLRNGEWKKINDPITDVSIGR